VIASLLPALDPWIVGAGMIVLSLLASWLTIFLSERRIHGAQRRLIRVITRRIEISLERAAREQVRRVYPAILSALDESRSDLDYWEATLLEAQQRLEEELDSSTVGASLATEVLLPGAEDLETELCRRLEGSLKDQTALEGVTLRALQAQTVSPWRALGRDELIGRLRQFAGEELRDKDFLPSVTSWLTDSGELSVGEQVQRVADWATPLQPMSQYDQPLARSSFVGTPEAIELGQEGPPDFHFVSTFAPSHLFVANVRCGVPLEKLPITQALRQRDEAVEQEVGV
jgi:hypothetical protein